VSDEQIWRSGPNLLPRPLQRQFCANLLSYERKNTFPIKTNGMKQKKKKKKLASANDRCKKSISNACLSFYHKSEQRKGGFLSWQTRLLCVRFVLFCLVCFSFSDARIKRTRSKDAKRRERSDDVNAQRLGLLFIFFLLLFFFGGCFVTDPIQDNEAPDSVIEDEVALQEERQKRQQVRENEEENFFFFCFFLS
jgi:hypothetical protein